MHLTPEAKETLKSFPHVCHLPGLQASRKQVTFDLVTPAPGTWSQQDSEISFLSLFLACPASFLFTSALSSRSQEDSEISSSSLAPACPAASCMQVTINFFTPDSGSKSQQNSGISSIWPWSWIHSGSWLNQDSEISSSGLQLACPIVSSKQVTFDLFTPAPGSIWVGFPRTGIYPDICQFLENFEGLLWPNLIS